MEDVIKETIKKFFDPSEKISTGEEAEAELSSLLFYSRWPLQDPEATLRELLHKGPRQVCQYQFKKNDIVWICKSCQKDETCVLCNECYQDCEGKHEGHEVYFYHSQAGGCCDCGDEGAWDPKGFCNKHGKTMRNPLENIPIDVQQAGQYVMVQIVEELVKYCKYIFNSFDLKLKVAMDEGVEYNLLLHNDDIHAVDDVTKALTTLGYSTTVSETIASLAHTQGWTPVGNGGSLQEIVSRAESLTAACDLHLSIVDKNYYSREETVLTAIHWLHRLAEVNDGMCRMICAALTMNNIRDIYVTDPRLPKKVASNLHHLFLTLMADQEFKIACSKAYALAFSDVADLYMNGIGTQENCLFGLSVQFLNRSIYVDVMVYNYAFLTSVINSLGSNLESTEGAFASHPMLLNRKYNPILGDLKVVFTLPDTSRYFCATCLDPMLKVFKLFQYIHPQMRELFQHVEYEGREWMHAFNLYLGFSSLFDYLVNWFVNENSMENVEGPTALEQQYEGIETESFDPSSVEILPTAMDVMMTIISAIMEWQQSRTADKEIFDDSVWQIVDVFPVPDIRSDGEKLDNEEAKIEDIRIAHSMSCESDDVVQEYLKPKSRNIYRFPAELKEKSFHIFLHRFLATSVREACRHPHLSDILIELQQYLHVTYVGLGGDVGNEVKQPGDQLIQLVDYPLQIIAWECQVRAGMWRRNGHAMIDQIMNYSEPPFCRIFKDLDVLLVQVRYCIKMIDMITFLWL